MTTPVPTEERRPAHAVDPRIRARRIAVRRSDGRRRLHRFTVAGAMAAVAAAMTAAALSPFVDVDRIDVSGADRSGGEAVVAASGIDVGEPLVTLDSSAAMAAIAALPWVDEVQVRRSWPGSVDVDVTERVAVAAIAEEDGNAALVDAGGRVLERVPIEASGPVLIVGLAPPGPPGTSVPASSAPAVTVAAALPADLLLRVEQIVVTGEGDLELRVRVDEGPASAVLLGDAGQLSEKLATLATLLASVDLTDVDVMDLEVPRAPALTRRRSGSYVIQQN